MLFVATLVAASMASNNGNSDDLSAFLPTPPGSAPHLTGPAMASPLRQIEADWDASLLPTPPGAAAAPSAPSEASAPSYTTGALPSTAANRLVAAKRTGKHKRLPSMKKRVGWKEAAKAHMKGLADLLLGNNCSRGCTGCDVSSFATGRLAEWCAEQTFGAAVLVGKWDELTPNHISRQDTFNRVFEQRVLDPHTGKVIRIDYKLDGHMVCMGTWSKFFAVAPTTASTMDLAVRKGGAVWNDGLLKQAKAERDSANGSLQQAAAEWWYIQLGYYEMVVEKGIIVHPRDVNFSNMYDDHFVPEMKALGIEWKLPEQGSTSAHAEQELDCSDREGGSRSSWYEGRRIALQTRAVDQYGAGHAAFKFLSRAKHSAYKECPDCQRLRLAVAEAIAKRMSAAEIRRRRQALADHIQWMILQRRCLDRMIQLSGNDGYLIEMSDKCGDSSLYLPATLRVSSDNASLYKYRLSLQANVYAGKLFHLSYLLPSLRTGANFGMTSALSGLVRMIQLGEVTEATRKWLRGMDGGSENVSLAGLALNSTLVKCRRFDVVQQSRLPPSHSHHWLTDGTFSVVEGWLTGDGFEGCPTLPELYQYLKAKFAKAKKYRDKRIEFNILIANFALTKWFTGHINESQVKRIGDPLVWSHTWVEATQSVLVQYKYCLSDEATFERDEWGPWLEKQVTVDDPESGEPKVVTVLRSDPKGVDLMRSYPDFNDDPGLEEYRVPAEKWKADKVFTDLQKWVHPAAAASDGADPKAVWDGMKQWHHSHPLPSTVALGEPITPSPGVSLPTLPALTWRAMWDVISMDGHSATGVCIGYHKPSALSPQPSAPPPLSLPSSMPMVALLQVQAAALRLRVQVLLLLAP